MMVTQRGMDRDKLTEETAGRRDRQTDRRDRQRQTDRRDRQSQLTD